VLWLASWDDLSNLWLNHVLLHTKEGLVIHGLNIVAMVWQGHALGGLKMIDTCFFINLLNILKWTHFVLISSVLDIYKSDRLIWNHSILNNLMPRFNIIWLAILNRVQILSIDLDHL